MSEQYKAVIDATVKLAVTIREYPNGETEIEEIDEVLEVVD